MFVASLPRALLIAFNNIAWHDDEDEPLIGYDGLSSDVTSNVGFSPPSSILQVYIHLLAGSLTLK